MSDLMHAISIITSFVDEYPTEICHDIIRVLNDTRSMQSIYKYLMDNKKFELCDLHCYMKDEYYYQNPIKKWNRKTGLAPDKYIYISLNSKPPFQIKQDIRRVLGDTHSAKKLVEIFEENGLFDEFKQNRNYRIPIELWEDKTDIARELVDLLPYVTDGSVHIDGDRNYQYDSREMYVYVLLDD